MSLIDPRARPSHRVRVALATIAMLGVTVASTGPAAAQQEPVPTPTTPLIVTESDADPAIDADSPVGQIIPGPNSGARPERPGDRGGSLQLGLFGLLLLFIAVAAWRIAVTGRSGRAAHEALAATPGADQVPNQTPQSLDGPTDESAPPPRAG